MAEAALACIALAGGAFRSAGPAWTPTAPRATRVARPAGGGPGRGCAPVAPSGSAKVVRSSSPPGREARLPGRLHRGANDAFGGFDGGWSLGTPYAITLGEGPGGISYRIGALEVCRGKASAARVAGANGDTRDGGLPAEEQDQAETGADSAEDVSNSTRRTWIGRRSAGRGLAAREKVAHRRVRLARPLQLRHVAALQLHVAGRRQRCAPRAS